ncbi:MAG: hypothetical protein UX87_C0019G0032 [Candidatus Amesbacteria bacterium GW2011_GWA1_47_16]|uniref:Uncharacterized protein n=2 Tax=Candidatus Amesiibacteriota TaxID=1752730 RepID=A0A0G1S5N7_9BACT|nr:MAG: hypothetical protein UX87_C0019G0032 [Candidatus Amesbacteria bacterium GW2011_GWA1_47_16]KKU64661.1 MAG: hypothetical protein UX86_C0006G0029 [Candidatus Amesbacteria bacterium GW2011_GWC1_47_15]
MSLTKRRKKIASIIIVIASLALLAGSILPYLTLYR